MPTAPSNGDRQMSSSPGQPRTAAAFSLPWNMPLRPDQAGNRETGGFRHVSGKPRLRTPSQCDRLAPAGSSSAARRESVSYACHGASRVLAFLPRWTADMGAPGHLRRCRVADAGAFPGRRRCRPILQPNLSEMADPQGWCHHLASLADPWGQVARELCKAIGPPGRSKPALQTRMSETIPAGLFPLCTR